MKKKAKKISADKMAEMALSGEDVTAYFSKGKMKAPEKTVQRVNVDFALEMLSELDQMANDLNISRQAVIKSLLKQGLDHHFLAKEARKKSS